MPRLVNALDRRSQAAMGEDRRCLHARASATTRRRLHLPQGLRHHFPSGNTTIPAISCAREQLPFGFTVEQDDAKQKSACCKDQITIPKFPRLHSASVFRDLREKPDMPARTDDRFHLRFALPKLCFADLAYSAYDSIDRMNPLRNQHACPTR